MIAVVLILAALVFIVVLDNAPSQGR